MTILFSVAGLAGSSGLLVPGTLSFFSKTRASPATLRANS